MKELLNKTVLFFCPSYFGYDKEITSKLRDMGAHVDAYDERPKNNFITKASIRINKNLVKTKIAQYYNNILSEIKDKQYDYVLVVNIEAMLPSVLNKFKQQQPNAVYILYMWDSLRNKKQTLSTLPYFDRIFSFDKIDTETLVGVKFRPLFYIDAYAKIRDEKANIKRGLCFIGTVHSDRYTLIQQIRQQVNDFGVSSYFFMFFHSPILFAYKKLRDVNFYKARFREFSFKSLSQSEIIKHIQAAHVILDIQHPAQTGLTMRTIEMLGAGKKLITTNADIKNYDFYNEQNIMIIDRNNPVLCKEFFDTTYQPLDEDLNFKYSIGGWVRDLLL